MFRRKKKKTKGPAPRDIVIGATSSLAYVLCHQLAKKGHHLLLVARNRKELERLRHDIHIRHGVEVSTMTSDLLLEELDISRYMAVFFKKSKPIEGLYFLAGEMGDTGYQERPENIEEVTRINYTNPAKLLAASAERLSEQEGGGTIIVVSSVAGERGRQSNYIYGSAKAALTAFSSGLRNKFFRRQVHVLTVKPGFIDTPMTFGMNSPLIASRELVARTIIRAAAKKRDVIFVPWRWTVIMGIICHIPEWLFKRLGL
jgi:short-subunit dehydrogenase